jgi:hypothetical protein
MWSQFLHVQFEVWRVAKWTAWCSQHDWRSQQRRWALSDALEYLWWPFVVGWNVPYTFSNILLARFIVLLHIIAFICSFWIIMHTLFSFFNTVLCELSLINTKTYALCKLTSIPPMCKVHFLLFPCCLNTQFINTACKQKCELAGMDKCKLSGGSYRHGCVVLQFIS